MTLLESEAQDLAGKCKVKLILLADGATEAPYGKVNLMGCVHSPRLLVALPYVLITNIVVITEGVFGRLSIDAIVTQGTRAPMVIKLVDEYLNSNAPEGRPTTGVVIAPFEAVFDEGGELTITVAIDQSKYQRTWAVTHGDAPLGGPAPQMQVAIDSTRGKTFDVGTLLNYVRSSIFISDTYLDRESFERIANQVPIGPDVAVRLLVGKRAGATFAGSPKLCPKIEVRTARNIHDRILMIDESAVYLFGHSLKDLNSGRVSFVTRVYDVEPWKLIRTIVDEEWNLAMPVRETE